MKYLTFNDLRAKLGGRARSSIYLDVEAARLPPPIKLGGRLYWCEQDVDEWLKRAPAEARERDAGAHPAGLFAAALRPKSPACPGTDGTLRHDAARDSAGKRRLADTDKAASPKGRRAPNDRPAR